MDMSAREVKSPRKTRMAHGENGGDEESFVLNFGEDDCHKGADEGFR